MATMPDFMSKTPGPVTWSPSTVEGLAFEFAHRPDGVVVRHQQDVARTVSHRPFSNKMVARDTRFDDDV